MEKKNKTEKAEDFIVSEEETGRTTSYILKNKTYLSQVFTKMPCGIVEKNHTGIGATSLELNAKRNSIIVQPLKVTASLKASKSSDYYYVGSPTTNHPKPFDSKELEKYLHNPTIKFKKIIIVADSLKKLMMLLKEEEKDLYFLMIDESDSFQLDSTFRPSMEMCYKVYKGFKKENRCMVTATPINFCDPYLADESIVIFKYEEEDKRTINLTYTNDNIALCIIKAKQLLDENPGEKIVVALNNVALLKEIADELVNKGVASDEITVLCSATNKKKAGMYTKNELENDRLPTLVNLITSAYYTGYDIDERYHLLVLIDGKNKLNQLSTNKLKQIVGRCRNSDGLLSENILQKKSEQTHDYDVYDYKDLFDAAQCEIESLKCFEKRFEKSSLLKGKIKDFKQMFSKDKVLQFYGFSLLTSDEEPEVSFLSLDAILEFQEKVLKVYKTKDGFEHALIEEGHVLTLEEILFTSTGHTVVKYDSTKKRLERVQATFKGVDLGFKAKAEDKIEELAYSIYEKYKSYVDKDDLKKEILEAVEKGRVQSLHALAFKILYHTLSDETEEKMKLTSLLEVGKVYLKKDLVKRFRMSFERLGLDEKIFTEKIIVEYLNAIFHLTRVHYTTEKSLKIKEILTFNMVVTGKIDKEVSKKFRSADFVS